MTDPDVATCVRCGAPLPADDRAGLCPRCLSSGTQSGQSQDAAVSPTSPQGARRKRWPAPAAAMIGAILLGGLWLGNGLRRKSDVMPHYERGLELADQGKLDEAITEYRAAIRIKPDHAEAHYLLGVALAVQGKLDEAIAEYRAAIRIKPDHAEAHYLLGSALASQGKLDEAIAEFRAAIRIKPDDAEAHYSLGVALAAQGKRDEAIAEYRAAIRTKPDHAEAHYILGNAPGKPGQAGRGDRRIPRGDPDQARSCRVPTTSWAWPWQARASGTRRSPKSARRATTPHAAPSSPRRSRKR